MSWTYFGFQGIFIHLYSVNIILLCRSLTLCCSPVKIIDDVWIFVWHLSENAISAFDRKLLLNRFWKNVDAKIMKVGGGRLVLKRIRFQQKISITYVHRYVDTIFKNRKMSFLSIVPPAPKIVFFPIVPFFTFYKVEGKGNWHMYICTYARKWMAVNGALNRYLSSQVARYNQSLSRPKP
jgi:hypothetical protein